MRKTVQSILDEGIIEKWEVKAIQAEYCGQAVVDVTEKYTEQLARLQVTFSFQHLNYFNTIF